YEAVENFVKTLPAILLQLQNDNSKYNLYFHGIISIIDATIANIQKTKACLSYHFQLFIDYMNPFNNNDNITYYMYMLAYNSCDYDNLLQDTYEYASIVTTEIKNHFPDCPLLTAMKILNPVEWSCFKNVVFSNFLTFFSQELLSILIWDYSDIFPNITKLVHITNSIPFSSVDCERGFSKQNAIKTCLQNSLNPFTLDAFMQISLEEESKKMNWSKIYREWYN
ncbi:4807_t:CDS:2, partial [Dentiscutata heterogama]